jgi:hypothetical protein
MRKRAQVFVQPARPDTGSAVIGYGHVGEEIAPIARIAGYQIRGAIATRDSRLFIRLRRCSS